MHKLKLQLEDLVIESFDTTAPARSKGTVFGEQCTCPSACSCPGCPTCDYTCDDHTCAASCNGSACSCPGCPTCDYTCDDHTCAASCNGTCNSCNGTCDGSCGGTCDASCYGCNYTREYVDTCYNIGTCDPNRGCMITP